MKRLLCILANMNAGGAEGFLMKLYRNLDRDNYQMDFCLNAEKNFYEKEIQKLGGKIYVVPPKSKNPIKTFNEIKSIVKENNYKYVMRVNEHSLSVIDLIAAKHGGAIKLIMRSSNASSSSCIARLTHKIFKFLPMTVPNVKIAPSMLAAKYTFGGKKVNLLKNALDLDQFQFDEKSREKYRKNLAIEDKIVIGHVGRFNEQKNHKFLIEIFNEFKKKNDNSILMLVGNGTLLDETKKQVKDLNLENDVMFMGLRSDVPQLLSAMDCFVFPSLYEGMPNTVIESQTNGLPCVISDTITEETSITPIVKRESLKNSAENWAHQITKLIRENKSSRELYCEMVKKQGYDIKDVVKQFEKLIFND